MEKGLMLNFDCSLLALVCQVAAAILQDPNPVIRLSLGHAALTKACLDLLDDFLEFSNP